MALTLLDRPPTLDSAGGIYFLNRPLLRELWENDEGGGFLVSFRPKRQERCCINAVYPKFYSEVEERPVQMAFNNQGHSHSTKSTSPGMIDDGPHENLYPSEKGGGLMAPDYPTKHI